MSIFGNIMSKIFHMGAEAAPAGTPPAGGAPSTASGAAPAPGGTSVSGGTPAPGGAPASGSAGTPAGSVDVAAVLTGLAAKAGQPLNWKQSIVDLMKLLDLDSSLTARKELAKELHYTGDTSDSATMNVWLHAQVMKKLAENGGKVPDDLKH